jgi:hypothetical protein
MVAAGRGRPDSTGPWTIVVRPARSADSDTEIGAATDVRGSA